MPSLSSWLALLIRAELLLPSSAHIGQQCKQGSGGVQNIQSVPEERERERNKSNKMEEKPNGTMNRKGGQKRGKREMRRN